MRPDHNDLDEEIRGHLALSIKERIERGEGPASARLAALKEFGNVTLTRDSIRSVWRPRWFDMAEALCQAKGFSDYTVLLKAISGECSTCGMKVTGEELLSAAGLVDSAEENAKVVQCASNLRQLGMAFVAYAQDFKNNFPPNVGGTAPPGYPVYQAWYDDDKIGKYLPKYAFPAPGSATIGRVRT